MDLMILKSKYHLPVQPRQMVSRPRLVSLLEKEIPRSRLAIISAPAGYGKTTLLAEWIHDTHLPIAWLSVGEEENDLESFLRYLVGAWETVKPDIWDTPLGILLGAQNPEIPTVLTAFINETIRVPDHLVFVLDDYHLIENRAVHEALAHILDHLPRHLHFILISRDQPPLPLSQYRINSWFLEVGTRELDFTPEESKTFLQHAMSLDLTADQVLSLHHQTEGWIAGLLLAALAIRRGQSNLEDSPWVSGRQRFVVDYLRESVLEKLPKDKREFLFQTSILERLCGPLCNALTGKKNGQTMLETVERENLFIVPLDDHREWFRYHTLFRDFLQKELTQRLPSMVSDLHRQATKWFSQNGLEELALHHALASDDGALTAQIAEPFVHRMILSGKLKKLQSWLDSIPQNWYKSYPIFGIAQASMLVFTGEFEAFAHRLDRVEKNIQASERENLTWQLAKLAALRCAVACFKNDLDKAETFAEQALNGLPESDHTYRAVIFHALGDTYRRIGHWQRARDYYFEVLGLTEDPAYHIRSVHVFGALADLDLLQGHLRDAAANWQRALEEIPGQKTVGSLPLPVIGWVYIRMGEILYEWNQLTETRTQVSRGLKHAELGGDEQAMMAGHLLMTRLELAEGNVNEADANLKQSRSLVAKNNLARWTNQYERVQIELWLAQHKFWEIEHWLDEKLDKNFPSEPPNKLENQLAITRVLILKEDRNSLEMVLRQLDHLLPIAESEGRMGMMVEILAFQAWALSNLGERTDALITLERALRLAESEGYVRLFIDLGLPMGRLLQEALARKVSPDYISMLLANFELNTELTGSSQTPIPQPLTPREQDVLSLIASGLTNREVAEKLVISPETVKKHTGNIYGKLGVSNRTQAVARARDLDLLA